MKIEFYKFTLFFAILAIMIPSYFSFAGFWIYVVMYLISALFFIITLAQRSSRVFIDKSMAQLYLISLLIYGVHVCFDTGFSSGINKLVSSLLVVLIVYYTANEKTRFLWVIDAIIFISIPFLLLGIVECATGSNVFQNMTLIKDFMHEYRLGIYRISSVFGQPIVYANFLCLLSCLVVYRMSFGDVAHKFLFKAVYLLVVLNVIMTVSRSIWLIFIAEQVVFLIACRKKILNFKFMIVVLAAALALCIAELANLKLVSRLGDMVNMILNVFGLGSDNYSTRFSSMGYSGVEGDRFKLYKWVPSVIRGHEMFGMGTQAQFSYQASEYREKTSIENYFLDTLFRHGYVGLIVAIIGLAGLLIFVFRRRKKKYEFEGALGFNFVFTIMLIGYIASMFMVNQSGEMRLFYVLAGLLLAFNKPLKIGARPAEVRNK